jgi:hypothetical protein
MHLLGHLVTVRRLLIPAAVVFTIAVVAQPGPLNGQNNPLPAPPAPTQESPLSAEDLEGLSQLIRQIALRSLPDDFENDKDWGRTKEVWAGLKISRDGLHIKTKRRKKSVKHGTWKKYSAHLVKPEETLAIQISNVTDLPGKGVGFDLAIDARIAAQARWAEWGLGVQLYNVGAEAEARVRIDMKCELDLSFDMTTFPPALALKPQVADAKLQLIDFRVHRISKLDGPVVKQIGPALHGVLEDEINDRKSKLISEINRAIAKREDDLRLSFQELLAKNLGRLYQRVAASDGDAMAEAAISPDR